MGYGHATWEDLVENEDGRSEEIELSRNPLIWIEVIIGGILEVKAVIDSGATHSCINIEMYKPLLEMKRIMGELPVSKLKLIGAVGKRTTDVRRQIMMEMVWSSQRYTVVALVVDGLFSSLVLGLDGLRDNRITIDSDKNIVYAKCIHEEMSNKSKKVSEGNAEEVKENGSKIMILTAQRENKLCQR